jgi:hypothetical protein
MAVDGWFGFMTSVSKQIYVTQNAPLATSPLVLDGRRPPAPVTPPVTSDATASPVTRPAAAAASSTSAQRAGAWGGVDGRMDGLVGAVGCLDQCLDVWMHHSSTKPTATDQENSTLNDQRQADLRVVQRRVGHVVCHPLEPLDQLGGRHLVGVGEPLISEGGCGGK